MRPDGVNVATISTAEHGFWNGRGIALSGPHRDHVIRVLDGMRALGIEANLPAAEQVCDYPTAHAALGLSWDRVLAALNAAVSNTVAVGTARRANGSATATDLSRHLALLDQIKRADHNLMVERTRQRDLAFARMHEALAVLREPDSTAALIEQAAAATCVLGFDRAILPRIEDFGGPAPAPRAPEPPGFVAQVPSYGDYLPTGGDNRGLTRREIEVLRLMAVSDTNSRIARRLVISEGTVKSHVKHILRKLRAANRAEAVSRWLRMECERAGSWSAGPGM